MPSFYFFSSSDKFLYLSLACFLVFLYHFCNNLFALFYHIFVFLIVSFFNGAAFNGVVLNKKITNTLFINQIRIVYDADCIIFAYIPKENSVSTSFNINNSNITKIHSFLYQIMTAIAKIWFILKNNVFKIPIAIIIMLFSVMTA